MPSLITLGLIVGAAIVVGKWLKWLDRPYGRNNHFTGYNTYYWCRCPGCKNKREFELIKLKDLIVTATLSSATWTCDCGINLFPTLVNHPVIKNILAEARLAHLKDSVARGSVKLALEKN